MNRLDQVCAAACEGLHARARSSLSGELEYSRPYTALRMQAHENGPCVCKQPLLRAPRRALCTLALCINACFFRRCRKRREARRPRTAPGVAPSATAAARLVALYAYARVIVCVRLRESVCARVRA